MTGTVSMIVPAVGGLRCELKRDDYGGWFAYIFKKRDFKVTYVVWGFEDQGQLPRFRESDLAWTLIVGRTHFELPEASWKRLKVWFDQVNTSVAERVA